MKITSFMVQFELSVDKFTKLQANITLEWTLNIPNRKYKNRIKLSNRDFKTHLYTTDSGKDVLLFKLNRPSPHEIEMGG